VYENKLAVHSIALHLQSLLYSKISFHDSSHFLSIFASFLTSEMVFVTCFLSQHPILLQSIINIFHNQVTEAVNILRRGVTLGDMIKGKKTIRSLKTKHATSRHLYLIPYLCLISFTYLILLLLISFWLLLNLISWYVFSHQD
jgi:hypothetical protein